MKEGLEKSVAGITVLVNPDKVCLVNFIHFADSFSSKIHFADSFSSWVELSILLSIKPLDIMRYVPKLDSSSSILLSKKKKSFGFMIWKRLCKANATLS